MNSISHSESAAHRETPNSRDAGNRLKRLRPALVIAAMAFTHGATAAIITHTQDFAAAQSSGGGWSAPVTFPFFDTLTGNLNQITIKWEGTVTDSLYLQSYGFGGFTGTVGTAGGVGIVDGSSTSLGSGTFAQTSHSVTLTQFESRVVGGSASGSLTWVLNPGDAGFQPYGILGATLYSSSMDGYITGMGLLGTMPVGVNSTEGRLTVTYDYSAVPEPSAVYGMAVLLSLVGVSTVRGRFKK